MKRVMALVALVVVGSLSVVVSGAQAPPAAKVIDIVKVKDNLYVLASSSPSNRDTFSGGNVAVFITDTGVTLVDTKLAGWGQVLLERIKSITNKPITTLINTHTHGDHTGNNELFGTTVDSIVQENTKTNMAAMDAYKGDKAQFLPKRTYKDKATIGAGKDRVELYYFGAGHTNGDTIVAFPELRIVHMGDLFPWKDAPFLDRANGGSGVSLPQTLQKAIAGLPAFDQVITGHHPVLPKADLVEFQRFTADLLAETQAAIKAGKTADQAAASLNLSAKYPSYKAERLKPAVQAIYDELAKK